METLKELFAETLKDVYFAENAILKALPKMAQKASSEELKEAFTEHAEETQEHVKRLVAVFKIIGEKAEGKECPALKGLVQETEELMSEASNADVLDAGLIGCAQAVEHYEMTRYGTLCAWGEQLELDDAVELLEETLEEEKATDAKLTELAMSVINEEADDEKGKKEDDDEDDEDDDSAKNKDDKDDDAKKSRSRKR